VAHLCGDVVEAAGPELFEHALVLERPLAAYHRVGFVGAVPVHRDVHFLRHANQQLSGLGHWVDAQNRNLRRVGAQLGNDGLPLQVFISHAHRLPGLPLPGCLLRDQNRAGKQAQEQSENYFSHYATPFSDQKSRP